jgi:Icc-related predicted phosphoesterase
MIITHVSDTHGQFPQCNRDDSIILVHSGDFLPNISRGIVEAEQEFQTEWVEKNIQQISDWIGNRIFVFCRGNHDFIDPTAMLIAAGIKAVGITCAAQTVCGLKFYGFPFIPFIVGEWMFETYKNAMSDRVSEIPNDLDILVAHCPPYGILSEEGNTSLITWLDYVVEKKPKMLLCGHFHANHGLYVYDGMLISNAATVVHHIQL